MLSLEDFVKQAKLEMPPPSPLQNILRTLERKPKNPKFQWTNKQNAWVRDLDSMEIGKLGEEIAVIYFGGKRTNSVHAGYDIDAVDKKIEVKTCSMRISNNYPLYNWQQIRIDDRYSHLALIAIQPEEVRCFLIPQSEVPFNKLKKQKNSDTFDYPTRKLENKWFTSYEIK